MTGEIEELLRWFDVKPGETFFIPAGTVHAIGAGIALCEIQQHSDVTYRLYDYGRPRELHLDKAMQVSDLSAHEGKPVGLPVDCQYFHTDLLTVAETITYRPEPARFHVLIVLAGAGHMADIRYGLGEAWLVPAGAEPFEIQPGEPTRLLRTWVP